QNSQAAGAYAQRSPGTWLQCDYLSAKRSFFAANADRVKAAALHNIDDIAKFLGQALHRLLANVPDIKVRRCGKPEFECQRPQDIRAIAFVDMHKPQTLQMPEQTQGSRMGQICLFRYFGQ